MAIEKIDLSSDAEKRDIASAINDLETAIRRLKALCSVEFVAVDDGDALLEFSNIARGKDVYGRDVVYIELTYP